MASAKRSVSTGERWLVAVYETAGGKRPALEYLGGAEVPDQPRRELLMTVLAVVQMGPLEFPTVTQRWRLMHKPAKRGDVDMSGIFEAGTGTTVSSTVCSACSTARRSPAARRLRCSAAAPSLTPQRVYRMIDRCREDYLATRRVAQLKTWPEWWPQPRS
jgi:hypothetical protein